MSSSASYSKKRRDKLRAMGKCINGPLDGNAGRWGVVHGPPVKGGKCSHCVAVWEKDRTATWEKP